MTNQQYEPPSIDTVSAALDRLDPSDRDEWIEMGMAIKSEFGEDGFDVWDNWSKLDNTYKPASAKASWKSFKSSGITIGSLLDKALQNGFKFEQKTLTAEEKSKLAADHKAKQEKRKQERAIEDEKNEIWRLKLSDFLTSIVEHFSSEGTSDYLAEKKVPGFGLFYPSEPMVIVADQDKDLVELHLGYEKMQQFLKQPKEDQPKFRIFKKGTIAVPVMDIEGRLWNLQFIYPSGKKSFFPGRKQGCFHLIGNIPPLGKFNICEVEGYSNGACVHMALTSPVLVAFDSSNLKPVAQSFSKLLEGRINRFAICADDDKHLENQNKKNVGLEKAIAAAKAVKGFVITPHINTSPRAALENFDLLYKKAHDFVVRSRRASISGIQRELKIGYNHASDIMNELETNNIVSTPSHSGSREVIFTPNSSEKNNHE